MPRITVELLRRRAEHNECVLSTLEEISLHQEELEKIEVLGTRCRKLRILYLQNNIIERIEDLTHMKELRYLNLALNNVSKIEGLQSCEFLDKLDLTVNFVDFDELENSIDHLKPLRHLRELYMLGNPCQANWPSGFPEYVMASLPQLEMLDGKEIHKSDRIKALQVFGERQRYVRAQAARVRAEKAAKRAQQALEEQQQQQQQQQQAQAEAKGGDVFDVVCGEATDISRAQEDLTDASEPAKRSVMASDEKVPYTPETRREMYMEMAEQKEEQEARRRDNLPRERDTEAEHEQARRQAREQEEREDGAVRQCNEGKWDFRLQDEPLEFVLELDLPRFLDSSLVDVDVHPSFVSVVAKNKLFRLRFPELVHSDKGRAKRSKVTGTLRLTLPKAHVTPTQRLRAQLQQEEREMQAEAAKTGPGKRGGARSSVEGAATTSSRTRKLGNQKEKLADELHEAAAGSRCVSIRGLAGNNQQQEEEMHGLGTKLTPLATKGGEPEEDDCPPLIY